MRYFFSSPKHEGCSSKDRAVVGSLLLSAWLCLVVPATAQEPGANPQQPGAAPNPEAGATPGDNSAALPMPQTNQDNDKLDIENLNRFLRVYEYNPGGRRDPFQPFLQDFEEEELSSDAAPEIELAPLERFDLDQIELLGIIWQVTKPKVMMKDPTGRVHIVGKNTKIGRNNGYIAVIREGELIVVESFEEDGEVTYQTRIMKLSR